MIRYNSLRASYSTIKPVIYSCYVSAPPDPCKNSVVELCFNDGTCRPDGTGGYTCICPPGYTGIQCKGSKSGEGLLYK